MKLNRKNIVLPLVVVMAMLGLSFGLTGSAQTVNLPLSCIGDRTVATDQAFMLTASGGTGSYTWEGEDLDVSDPTGAQFIAHYGEEGTYDITVTSGGESDTCEITVEEGNAGTLECSPIVQTVTLGQTASMSASGGTGSYTWSSPELTITNPNGSGFSASFATAGFKTLTVRSGTREAFCSVNVLPGVSGPIVIPVPTVPTTPGFPNTGGGFGR